RVSQVSSGLVSGGRRLDFHLARAPASAARDATRNGVVLVHELPEGPGSGPATGSTYPQLADRIAEDTGWVSLTFTCRGAGRSPGQFGPQAWLDDVKAAAAFLNEQAGSVWLAGFGFGGALALRVAAADETIGGVAAMAAPADLSKWIRNPASLAALAHEAGLVDSAAPAGFDQWASELEAIDPIGAARALAPRPLLIVQGSADETTALDEARALADAAEGYGELRVITMAGARLRHDPRTVAVLLGWLERHST
ncbi:MAG: alpha/beta hydrolase family protein, partial [Acidimicrobiales bacterium]